MHRPRRWHLTVVLTNPDDVLERREPHVFGLQGLLKPLIYEAPAGEAAGEEGMPDADPEAAEAGARETDVGAEHIERSMRQIDEIHDPENQRQSRRQQEQDHAKLNAIQELFGEKNVIHRQDSKTDGRDADRIGVPAMILTSDLASRLLFRAPGVDYILQSCA